MKHLVRCILFAVAITLPVSSYANWIDTLKDISRAIIKLYGVNVEMKDIDRNQLDQLKGINNSLLGKHNYGSRDYDDDAYSWGMSANSWQQILALSRNGGGNGQLGDTILSLAKEYPIQDDFNSPNTTESDYYRLQAQTSLASRSAAELSYKQAVEQEKRMRTLHDLIDQVEDEKSASDLNNRLSSEQAMTSLQQTKLLSILVQQQAVAAQEKANRAKEDMEFYKK